MIYLIIDVDIRDTRECIQIIMLCCLLVEVKENCPIFLHISVDMHDPFYILMCELTTNGTNGNKGSYKILTWTIVIRPLIIQFWSRKSPVVLAPSPCIHNHY